MRFRLVAFLLLLPALLFLVGCSKDDDNNTPATQHNITVTVPNGGKSWGTGSTHDITWSDNNVTNTKVLVSADNGTNWTVLIATTTANTYSWTTPTVAGTTYKIKVVDAADSTVSDVSDAAFALTDADAASHAYTSTAGGTFETDGGARMTVPAGAVPLTDAGLPGTMVFSIERNNDVVVTAPTGETRSGDVYQFGPEGFTLARPVEIALPIPGTGDPGQVKIWRLNPSTQLPEYFGCDYDSTTRTVRAQTYQFSPWFATTSAASNTSSGCLNVTNSTNRWLYMCVESVVLDFAEQAEFVPELGQGVLWAPQGEIGWASTGHWYLPQGVYDFCVQVEEPVNSGHYVHELRAGIQVTEPWSYSDPVCTDLGVGSLASADTGRCVCVPLATTSVGTGDIQVTLVWHREAALDLDLWVMDPDSEWCYYGNGQAPSTTTSGGQLDRDNLCGNYVNGRPENIYWTTAPLAGEYIVAVDWYSSCGNTGASQDFNVRTVVQGTTHTFAATIPEGTDMLEVTRFTIVGSTVQFLPPRPEVTYPNLPANAVKTTATR